MPLIGKMYEIDTTVTIHQQVTVTKDDRARYHLNKNTTDIPLCDWTDEEIRSAACRMARERITDRIEGRPLETQMQVTNTGNQEFTE